MLHVILQRLTIKTRIPQTKCDIVYWKGERVHFLVYISFFSIQEIIIVLHFSCIFKRAVRHFIRQRLHGHQNCIREYYRNEWMNWMNSTERLLFYIDLRSNLNLFLLAGLGLFGNLSYIWLPQKRPLVGRTFDRTFGHVICQLL